MDSKGAQAGGICSLVNNSDVHGVEALLTLWHADGVIEKHSLPETSFQIQIAELEDGFRSQLAEDEPRSQGPEVKGTAIVL